MQRDVSDPSLFHCFHEKVVYPEISSSCWIKPWICDKEFAGGIAMQAFIEFFILFSEKGFEVGPIYRDYCFHICINKNFCRISCCFLPFSYPILKYFRTKFEHCESCISQFCDRIVDQIFGEHTGFRSILTLVHSRGVCFPILMPGL